jgi:hypothetical protein
VGEHRRRPRDISLNADEGGPTSASFVLDREAGVRYPDIASLTPVEIEVPGLLAWDGRVTATPERRESGATSSIAVECEGWRAHLDDDPIDVPFLVHDNLSEWIDCRTIPGVSLARGVGFPSTGTVSTEGRSILMGLPRGAYLAQFDRVVGAQVDLGEGNQAKRVVMEIDSVGPDIAGNPNYTLFLRGTDTAAGVQTGAGLVGDYANLGTVNLPAGGAVLQGTLSTGFRYVSVFLYHFGAFNGDTTAEGMIRITAIRCFADAAYETAGRSGVTIDTMATYALAAAPMLQEPTYTSPKLEDDIKGYPLVSYYWRLNARAGGTTQPATVHPATDIVPQLDAIGTVTFGATGLLVADPEDDANRCVDFPGTGGGYLLADPIKLENSFGLFCVINLDVVGGSAGGNGYLFSTMATAATSEAVMLYVVSDGRIILDFFNDLTQSAVGTIQAGQTYTVLATYDRAEDIAGRPATFIYLNGQQVASGNAGPFATANPIVSTRIGASFHDTTRLNGRMQEVAILGSSALTATPWGGAPRAHDALRWHEAARARRVGDIQRGAYRLPHTHWREPKSPRELIDAANAPHNFQVVMRTGRRLVIRKRPALPTLRTGGWHGAPPDDATAGSTQDLVSSVSATGTAPDGKPLYVIRSTVDAQVPTPAVGTGVQVPGIEAQTNPIDDPDNPNTAGGGWIALSGSVLVSQLDNTWAVGKTIGQWRNTATTLSSGMQIEPFFAKGFRWVRGICYVLTCQFRVPDTTGPGNAALSFMLGTSTDEAIVSGTFAEGGTIYTLMLPWAPRRPVPRATGAIKFRVVSTALSNPVNFSGFRVREIRAGLVARAGFARHRSLQVGQPATEQILAQLADLYLSNHQAPPYRGAVTAYPDSIRRQGADDLVPLAALLSNTGEILSITDAEDPTTGIVARDARIVGVGYNHDAATANLSLDNQRGDVDALFARYGVRLG